MKIARRNLEAGHVTFAGDAAQCLLEYRKTAACRNSVLIFVRSPQAAGGVQHVHVRQTSEWRLHSMERKARLDQREVERLAVEADNPGGAVGDLRDTIEQRRFRGD